MKKAIISLFTIAACCATMQAEAKEKPNCWENYFAGKIEFVNASPETKGAKIYNQIIPNPEQYITKHAKTVLETLYFSPKDSIPKINDIRYVIKDYNGISGKGGNPPAIQITYSTQWIEKSFANQDTAKLDYETRGVLYHELTHGYQLEPQGIGNYGNSKVFWAFIEGMADAVRYINGCFGPENRPKGGTYMDGYRTTGFFFAWLKETKDPDFIRKFNRSTLEVIPWSFDGAIKHVLGQRAQIDELWKEYQLAMGDID